MMKTFTKLSVTAAASILGVGLVASGAYAATSALTTRDVPGQVLQVSGVVPASDHAKVASVVKPDHGNARVKVPSVATTIPMAAGHGVVGQVARPAAQTLPAYHPVMPQTTASTRPAVPQPMMTSGTKTPPSPMH